MTLNTHVHDLERENILSIYKVLAFKTISLTSNPRRLPFLRRRFGNKFPYISTQIEVTERGEKLSLC